jgi:hypothetical protein
MKFGVCAYWSGVECPCVELTTCACNEMGKVSSCFVKNNWLERDAG